MGNLMLRRRVLLGLLSEDYIIFADPVVEQICATNWGDGVGLKPSQAARVTDTQLGTVFRSNTNITSFNELVYFTGITAPRPRVFQACSNLVEVELPPTCTTIGNGYAFYGCSSLAKLKINSVVTSNTNAFTQCTSLKRVDIPDIETWLLCWTDTTDNSQPFRASNEGHLYINDVEVTQVVVPSTITSLRASAFYACVNITSVTIPSTVTSIGGSAFERCSALTSLTIPSSVTSIGGSVFAQCTSLSGTLYFPSSVTSIGNNCFTGCTSLKNVVSLSSATIGEMVSNNGAFGDGTGIFYHEGSFSHSTAGSFTWNFNAIIIKGSVNAPLGSRVPFGGTVVEQIRIGGDLTLSNYYITQNTGLMFLEVGGTITKSSSTVLYNGNGKIVHLGKTDGIACAPTVLVASNAFNSRIAKVYVGDGSSQAADEAVLAMYLADTDWATYSSKLDIWYNYNGDYKTPPTIPTQS